MQQFRTKMHPFVFAAQLCLDLLGSFPDPELLQKGRGHEGKETGTDRERERKRGEEKGKYDGHICLSELRGTNTPVWNILTVIVGYYSYSLCFSYVVTLVP